MQTQIQWVASLRGLLVFLVFFSHLHLPVPKDIMFVIGRIGVVGFFLISGYLAVLSLARRKAGQFLLNRFMRIYPIYWLLLIMTYLLAFHTPSLKALFWNFTLFEEFVGYEAMIGSAWMLPIMILFFILLLFLKGRPEKIFPLFLLICIGSVAIGTLRYLTRMPFPTALCLLLCIGLIGYVQNVTGGGKNSRHEIIKMLLVFEPALVLASYLSYGERTCWYFMAYNLGFILYYLFQKFNMHVVAFDKLGELGFTFFLGASIPVNFLSKFIPGLSDLNVYAYASLQFVLSVLFAYVITRYCERPLLEWGKRFEKRL